MRKYYRLIIKGFKLIGLIIVWILFIFLGIFGLACHRNDSSNCTVFDLAAIPELHVFVIYLLAYPFLSASFEIADADASIVKKILWPIFGLSLSSVLFIITILAYLAIKDTIF